MKSLAELDQLNLDPATKSQVAALVQALVDQASQEAKTVIAEQQATITANEKAIRYKDTKITSLTYELAYYKRIRYSTKSETLGALQRDVFEETWNTDRSAIEAEVEHLQENQPCETVARPKRLRAGRQPLPTHLPRIDHYHPLVSCTCGQCGRDLVKIRDDCMDAGGRATQEQLPKM